ncbi:MAG: molybdopterin-synthase adenylyltransferase MoeB [Thermoanaerobaculia bacterium]
MGNDLSTAEIARYARHLSLAEVGMAGQERLKAARVLVVGAGGLGSPAALYLAAAGVGTIGLVDFDFVDRSNLQRQILFGESDVGKGKLDAAVARLRETNPHVVLEPHAARVAKGNVAELVAGYDLVVDGTDNFPTRYLVHDAAFFAGKPYIYGSIFRFEGQASVFAPASARGGPCFRCLFPEPPPPGAVPSCAEAGVIGVLPGIIGSIQANETIKWILGVGEPLVGRLLLFDALAMHFREVGFRRSADCPLCSESPSQTGLVEYDDNCLTPAEEEAFEITPREVARRQGAGEPMVIVDVRLPHELHLAAITGVLAIPLHELPSRVHEVPRDRAVVTLCHVGVRSLLAAELLREAGHTHVRSLAGGIDAWSREIDPDVPRY